MSKTIGIDLGTTNSCISVIEGSKPLIIPNTQGGRTTPSVVAKSPSGELLVGDTAKRQLATNGANTITSIKRRMGFDDMIKLGDEEYSPAQISSMILKNLKTSAEEFLGEPVIDAIITVPAYFTDAQRQETKSAGTLAGLNVVRIINEPTAAALAYGLETGKEETVLVYDLGGGTFDISILRLSDGIFNVIATSGNNKLGGDDFDCLLANFINSKFMEENNVDLMADPISRIRVMEAAEKAKIDLSSALNTTISIPYVTITPNGPLHLSVDVKREEFEALILDLITETMNLLKETVQDADLEYNQIDKVLLVGGSTRIPLVPRLIEQITGLSPSKNINPDECVAMGAAIQGGIIQGNIQDLLLLDVTPLSLGVEVQGGLFSRIIEKNTTIPYTGHKIFSTAVDNQKEVAIKVYQGERELAANNKLLGDFILSDIDLAPRGIPQIDVIFDIDINGIVNISAVDIKTGSSKSITIAAQNNLTDEEVKQIISDAAQNAQKDKDMKKHIELINEAHSAIEYAVDVLKDEKIKISDKDREKAKILISELKTYVLNENFPLIQHSAEELNKLTSELLVSNPKDNEKKSMKDRFKTVKKASG